MKLGIGDWVKYFNEIIFIKLYNYLLFIIKFINIVIGDCAKPQSPKIHFNFSKIILKNILKYKKIGEILYMEKKGKNGKMEK